MSENPCSRNRAVISYPYAGRTDKIARTMPSSVPLSISVICLTTEHFLGLLSVIDYRYIVTLNSGVTSFQIAVGRAGRPPHAREGRESSDQAPRGRTDVFPKAAEGQDQRPVRPANSAAESSAVLRRLHKDLRLTTRWQTVAIADAERLEERLDTRSRPGTYDLSLTDEGVATACGWPAR